MKKTILIIAFVLVCIPPAFSLEFNAGGTLGYSYTNYGMELTETSFSGGLESEIHSYNITALADITYCRLGIGYTRNFSDIKVSGTGDFSGNSITLKKADVSFMNLTAVAKYPFKTLDGQVNLWPAIGLGYDINLTNRAEGDTWVPNPDLNDLYLLLGGGVDYNLNSDWALALSFIYGYNLTPKASKDNLVPVSAKYSGYKLNLNFGVLFRI